MAEIARCKKTFCYFLEPRYSDFNLIVTHRDQITMEFLEGEVERINLRAKKGVTPLTVDGLVIRLMTHEHIPLDPERKRRSRVTNEAHAHTNFPPYKHFLVEIVDGEIALREVGRSHWEGGFENGHFTANKGRVTERMGAMFKLLVDRYSNRRNWRSYSYREEMCGLALLHLCQVGLQFDESKGSNPFAFYTTTMKHCFTRTFNVEKKQQEIRDEILIRNNRMPSMARQIEDELSRTGIAPPRKLPAKRGRKSAVQVAAEKKATEDEKHQ